MGAAMPRVHNRGVFRVAINARVTAVLDVVTAEDSMIIARLFDTNTVSVEARGRVKVEHKQQPATLK
jgi:hypothetical protein